MKVTHFGSCHCGLVKWEADCDDHLQIVDCNCSICCKKQNQHVIVPRSDFRLLTSESLLTTYTFNTHTAKHTFCSACGVQSFYYPRSNADSGGVGIMPHCIDSDTVRSSTIIKWDGVNWENSMEKKGEQLKAMSS